MLSDEAKERMRHDLEELFCGIPSTPWETKLWFNQLLNYVQMCVEDAIEFQVKKAIAEFAQRIAEEFGEYDTDYTYEQINEDPAGTLLSPADLAYVFEEQAKQILDEKSTQRR